MEWKQSWSKAFSEFDDIVKAHFRKSLPQEAEQLAFKFPTPKVYESFEHGMDLRPRRVPKQMEFGFLHAPTMPEWLDTDTSVEEFGANVRDLSNASHLFGEHLPGAPSASFKTTPELELDHDSAKAIGFTGAGAFVAGMIAMSGKSRSKVDYSKVGLFGNGFSGRDDEYNTIEGLKHGGQAQVMRRKMTPFGSGWDPLRNLVADHLGQGEDVFRKFIGSTGFQEALQKGSVVRELGQGGFGEAHLMKTSVELGGKSHPFEYVRKTHFADGANKAEIFKEHSAANRLADLNAPTMYATTGNDIDGYQSFMEAFKGKDAREHMLAGGSLTKEQVGDIRNFFEEAHKRGVAHMDAARDAALFNRQSYAAREYSGELLPHNMMITENGRIGVYDFGLASHPNAPANPHFTETFMGKKYDSVGDIDMDLVKSLERNEGKISNPKFLKSRQMVSAATKLEKVKASTTSFDVFGGKKIDSGLEFANTTHDSQRKIAMAETQRNAVANMFESGIFGGKRSKSRFASAAATRR